jgi:hypothetical protein
MEALLGLCAALGRTRLLRDRAWAYLIADGELWRLCRQALRRPQAPGVLAHGYRLLAGAPARAAARAALADAAEADRVHAAACRLLAAGVLAALARHRRNEPRLEERLGRWARRAGAPAPWGPPPAAGEEDEEAVLRRCLSTPAAGPGRAAAAAALDAARELLGVRPAPEGALRVPLVLARGDEGLVARLYLVRQAEPPWAFFRPLAARLAPVSRDVRRSLRRAWRRVAAREGRPHLQVRWWLGDLPGGAGARVAGASLEAAAEVGLTLLARGRGYDPACAVTATVAAGGRLGPVRGLAGAAPKLAAARVLRPPGGCATVVVCPEDLPPEPQRLRWLAAGVRVLAASDAEEACARAAGPAAPARRRPLASPSVLP